MLWDKKLLYCLICREQLVLSYLCFPMKKTTQMILVDFTLTAKCCLGCAFLFVPAFFVFLLSIMIFSFPNTDRWKLLWTNESSTREICEWTERRHPTCTGEFCFLHQGQVQPRSQYSWRFQSIKAVHFDAHMKQPVRNLAVWINVKFSDLSSKGKLEGK